MTQQEEFVVYSDELYESKGHKICNNCDEPVGSFTGWSMGPCKELWCRKCSACWVDCKCGEIRND